MTPAAGDRDRPGDSRGPRRFIDARGRAWEARAHLEAREDWSSADEETHRSGYPVGWLHFTSGEVRKRLRLFPPNWWTLDDAELERLARRARTVDD